MLYDEQETRLLGIENYTQLAFLNYEPKCSLGGKYDLVRDFFSHGPWIWDFESWASFVHHGKCDVNGYLSSFFFFRKITCLYKFDCACEINKKDELNERYSELVKIQLT